MPQDYTATIFLRQRWTDERLVFEGNKSLSLDGRLVELLWVPDTFIVDSKKSFLHDITVENRLIRIFPNGTVLYALRWGIWVDFPVDGGSCCSCGEQQTAPEQHHRHHAACDDWISTSLFFYLCMDCVRPSHDPVRNKSTPSWCVNAPELISMHGAAAHW